MLFSINLKLTQCIGYLVSTVDTEDQVLWHQAISSHGDEHVPNCFQRVKWLKVIAFNSLRSGDACLYQLIPLVKAMVWHLFGGMPLPKTILTHCQSKCLPLGLCREAEKCQQIPGTGTRAQSFHSGQNTKFRIKTAQNVLEENNRLNHLSCFSLKVVSHLGV